MSISDIEDLEAFRCPSTKRNKCASAFESLHETFPFDVRGNQRWVLDEMSRALSDPNIKYVVVQAPTGTGKSPLAMAVALAAKSAYIMTANKKLQDQYIRDFAEYIVDMRGRSNYKCHVLNAFNCADAPCRNTLEGRKKCGTDRKCEYHGKLDEAAGAPITSLNFAAAIAYLNHCQHMFESRNVLLIDEAHLIEQELTGYIELSVSTKQLTDFGLSSHIPQCDTTAGYIPWIKDVHTYCERMKDGSFEIKGMYDRFKNFSSRVAQIYEEVARDAKNIIVQHDSGTRYSGPTISFRPIDVSQSANEKLFQYGEKVVFMSATIINYGAFLNTLGIDPNKSVFIDVPSTFPEERRQIVRDYVDSFGYANLQQPAMQRRIADEVERLMTLHANVKGIIHLPSYTVGGWLYEALSPDAQNRMLYPRTAGEQVAMLVRHTKPGAHTVLMSPSMAEGVDLKDDLSRFQIIVKVPFPSMGDVVVKARMNRPGGDRWYATQTMMKLIQMYGRSVRSEQDHAVTYILDRCFDKVYMKTRAQLPHWFREAIEDL